MRNYEPGFGQDYESPEDVWLDEQQAIRRGEARDDAGVQAMDADYQEFPHDE